MIALEPEQFYYLARATSFTTKDKSTASTGCSAKCFMGRWRPARTPIEQIPEEWLRRVAELYLTPEQMAEIEALGSWDEIMEALKKRLAEQEGRHEGGSKWIGTGGTSPFGLTASILKACASAETGRQGRAIKVWEQREFRDLDGSRELGTRNIKVALRRLRRFAREGAADELDLDATIDGTARQGWLDVHMRPERHNAVKLLLFLDIGGSMEATSALRGAILGGRSEFKHLEHFTSTIASTKACGRTIAAASSSARRPGI